MMKIKKYKEDIIIFLILLVFTSIIFAAYLGGHLAGDTFNIMNIGYERYAIEYSFTDGRIIMGIIGLIASVFNITILSYIRILDILAIIVTCTSIIVLKNIIIKYKKTKNIIYNIFLIITCYYTIYNYTYIENMYFAECFVMALSILLYILAANKIVNSNKKDNLEACALVILGVISYQGTISAFLIFTVIFSLLKEDNLGKTIKNLIKAAIICFIASAINIILIKCVEQLCGTQQTRTTALTDILSNIFTILERIPSVIINTSKLFPPYLLIITTLVIVILVGLRTKDKKDNKRLFIILMLILLSIAFAFILSVISLTAFNSARIRFSIGAMIGIIYIYLITKCDLLETKNIISKILISIFIVYGIINSFNYIYLINLNIQVNTLDKKIGEEIAKYIEEYEIENNQHINKICPVLVKGQIYKAYYDEMNCNYVSVGTSAIRTQWSCVGAVNWYANLDLKQTEMTENELKKYKDNVDAEKGYLCINDTLYVSYYQY